jgi:hypothetical protein
MPGTGMGEKEESLALFLSAGPRVFVQDIKDGHARGFAEDGKAARDEAAPTPERPAFVGQAKMAEVCFIQVRWHTKSFKHGVDAAQAEVRRAGPP